MLQYPSCRETFVSLTFPSPYFWYTNKGIKLTLAPVTHKALQEKPVPSEITKVKLPGSLSLGCNLFCNLAPLS